jgi:hypothetical protein
MAPAGGGTPPGPWHKECDLLMHDQGTPSKGAIQRAVLSLVLDAHPTPLKIPNLAREIDAGDAVEAAVRDLIGVGLLECSGITVRPSTAALHFERLELP